MYLKRPQHCLTKHVLKSCHMQFKKPWLLLKWSWQSWSLSKVECPHQPTILGTGPLGSFIVLQIQRSLGKLFFLVSKSRGSLVKMEIFRHPLDKQLYGRSWERNDLEGLEKFGWPPNANTGEFSAAETWAEASAVLTGRENEKVHLRLCNDVNWFQMVNGGHFHLEQPQGSEAILQSKVRDIYHGTLCTTFDMCEVGKLLAPKVMQRTRGNNYLRKRATVYTSSKIFHEAFYHQYCPGNHQHVPIAGKVFHLGKWISVSEYAARYSSGFGRNVARYLYCGVVHVPLMWNEMEASPEVTKDFVGAVISQKRDAAALVPTLDSHGPDWKRDRHA